MADFSWGVFWALLAAFAVRGVWRATIGQWMARENEKARKHRNMNMDSDD